LTLASVLSLAWVASAVAACPVVSTVGLDTAYANSYGLIELGCADGQTFLAPDSVVQAITVWRFAADAGDGSTWRIFVMPVDSLGVPDVNHILQDGPTLQIIDGGAPHMTPFRFVFDPPVVLPMPGEYEFAIQGNNCQGYSGFSTNDSDGHYYPDGTFWDHGRQAFSCTGYPRAFPTQYSNSDMVFTIEFCTTPTGARPVSWGQIKALYR
jgi:hypothetical protein